MNVRFRSSPARPYHEKPLLNVVPSKHLLAKLPTLSLRIVAVAEVKRISPHASVAALSHLGFKFLSL
jgi:hypothetical protein